MPGNETLQTGCDTLVQKLKACKVMAEQEIKMLECLLTQTTELKSDAQEFGRLSHDLYYVSSNSDDLGTYINAIDLRINKLEEFVNQLRITLSPEYKSEHKLSDCRGLITKIRVKLTSTFEVVNSAITQIKSPSDADLKLIKEQIDKFNNLIDQVDMLWGDYATLNNKSAAIHLKAAPPAVSPPSSSYQLPPSSPYQRKIVSFPRHTSEPKDKCGCCCFFRRRGYEPIPEKKRSITPIN